jgi:hypothetical protein
MSTYKVIQDIEAEDHILGPLTLRQFIYALIAVFFLYLSFICLTKHAAFLIIFLLPPAIFTGFLAYPFGKDQPTEVWALAKIRYLIKPHRRIWDQSGVKELVTITVPKKIEIQRTNGLSQNEVKSRLEALASTIDSRGWAIKNVNVNMYAPQTTAQLPDDSDRLISIESLPQAVPDYDVRAADDILDEKSNPLAQHMDQMISASTAAHHQDIINELQAVGQPVPAAGPGQATAWFTQTPTQAATVLPYDPTAMPVPVAVSAPVTAADQVLLAQMRAQQDLQYASHDHLRTLQPLPEPGGGHAAMAMQAQSQLPATSSLAPIAGNDSATNTALPNIGIAAAGPTGPSPVIMSLANNNDLNVATLAREAHKVQSDDGQLHDEVVISLH